MDIEIIEIAVNPVHVHIFFKYPPKYSLSSIPMNTIERNIDDFSYRPRYYFVRGIPVTEGEQTLMLS